MQILAHWANVAGSVRTGVAVAPPPLGKKRAVLQGGTFCTDLYKEPPTAIRYVTDKNYSTGHFLQTVSDPISLMTSFNIRDLSDPSHTIHRESRTRTGTLQQEKLELAEVARGSNVLSKENRPPRVS